MRRETRRVPIEFRDDPARMSPGIVRGRVISFGEWADIGGMFRERIMSLDLADRITANVQHSRQRLLAATGPNGRLRIDRSTAGIDAVITLPDTSDGRDAATLIREQALTGLSVEMEVGSDEWNNNDRTVRSGMLYAVGIVDTPAYAGSMLEELRANAQGEPHLFRDLRGNRVWL